MIGWYRDNWYMMPEKSVNCTTEQMKEVLEGHITTEALMLNQDDTPTISTMVRYKRLYRRTNKSSEIPLPIILSDFEAVLETVGS